MFGIEDFAKSIVNFSDFDISQLGDAFLFGGTMLLIGMVTIFSVLCLLWGCLLLFKICFHDLPAKKAALVPQVAEAPTAVASTSASSSDDEIVAVIAAAIAMAESENSDVKFRVVSFKRK